MQLDLTGREARFDSALRGRRMSWQEFVAQPPPAAHAASSENAFAWNRWDNLPKGHRLYTSPATLARWPRAADVLVDYDVFGWHITRPGNGVNAKPAAQRLMIEIEPRRFINHVSAIALGLVIRNAPLCAHYICEGVDNSASPWSTYHPIRLGRVSVGVSIQRRYRDSITPTRIPPHRLHGVLLQPIAMPQFLHAADRMMRRLRWRETGDITLLRPTGVPVLEPRRRDAPAPRSGRVRYRGGYPALHWLAKRDPAGALAVLQYIRALSSSQAPEHDQVETPLLADNDNDVHDAYAHDGVGEAPVSLGFSEIMTEDEGESGIAPEHLHVIKPSVNEMLADMLRVRFVRYSDGQTHSVTGMDTRPIKRRGKIVLAGMTFWRNPSARKSKADPLEMQSYADSSARVQKPRVDADKPKGGKSNSRSDEDIARYLGWGGAVASPLTAEALRTPLSGEPALMPMLAPMRRRAPNAFVDAYGKFDAEGRFGVEEAREYLRHYGVDGSVSFEDLPFPATKCPPRKAKGARFIGGRTGSKPTRTTPGRSKVSEPIEVMGETAIVLEEVAARGTLTSIGQRLGKRRSYADRYGKRALVAAAQALVAANDNASKKLAA